MNARERAEQAYAKIENNTEFLSDETIITQAIEDAERDAWNDGIDAAVAKFTNFGKQDWTREEVIEILRGMQI